MSGIKVGDKLNFNAIVGALPNNGLSASMNYQEYWKRYERRHKVRVDWEEPKLIKASEGIPAHWKGTATVVKVDEQS